MKQEWINDSRLKDIEKSKLVFLSQALLSSGSLSQKQALPFIMAMAVRAKNEKISFSSDETTRIMNVMKEYADGNDLQQLEQMAALTQFL